MPTNVATERRHILRRFAVVILALVAVGLLLWLVKIMLVSEQTATMITAPATIGDIEESVLASGTLKPVKLVAVGAQVSGRVTSLKVSLGQTVRAGDLIAEIDSLTQQNSLRTAEATLAYTRAQRLEKEAALVLAEATLARQQLTWAQKASSRAEYDSAEATVKTTRAQLAQLDAQIVQAEVGIETARINLGYTRITAPIDGTVLLSVTQEGQTVNAVQSAPTIVILGQLDTMMVRAEISEADVVKVHPGQPVYFTVLGDRKHRHYARLGSIEPAPESIRNDSSFSATTATTANSSSSSSSTSAVYYNGIFTIPNTDRKLRTYMTAEVHIILAEARKVLTIPAAALGNAGPDESSTVRIAGSDGRITTRTIKIGLNNKITVEVKAGLKEGEHVVIGERSRGASEAAAIPSPPGEL
ncbi:efflux RND transporter periplasmic adaptor subunit [Bradyrhizobium australiense]|uniref:Efflux RND transporter periplasmic adaptor subunit n=1 Tax=Bradyrhizobium australiense TaxID=2721161 RepID=A0A7Y4LUW2_9BRAD|nr:efflux RND transporter periplasmic adaptor subunit [Bradyrhizobium australiense]